MALVPGGTKLGDITCIFQGSIAGHVLAPIENKGHGYEYRHVSAAYIHGLMYGEIQVRRQEKGLVLQDFVLV